MHKQQISESSKLRKRNKQAKDFSRAREKSGTLRGEWIYGRRPVIELLSAAARHLYEAVLPADDRYDTPELAYIRKNVLVRNIPFRQVECAELDELCGGGNHQGVALHTGSFPYVDLEQIVNDVNRNPNALVILLDHIEDPQNTGSILRSANAVGATGVVIPADRSAGVTPAVVRASSGASEHMRVARVVNLTRAIKTLQQSGLWITVLDADAHGRIYTDIDFKGRVGLVVGSEGSGVGRLVRTSSDFVAELPMRGKVASLNAGVAAAIVMYEVLRQRSL